MNKEVKKILDEINKFPYGKFYGLKQEQVNQIKQLLDYITNIEQQYEKSLEDSVKESHRRMELEQEIQDLRADYGSKAQVERDLLELENEKLKKEIERCKKNGEM